MGVQLLSLQNYAGDAYDKFASGYYAHKININPNPCDTWWVSVKIEGIKGRLVEEVKDSWKKYFRYGEKNDCSYRVFYEGRVKGLEEALCLFGVSPDELIRIKQGVQDKINREKE